MTVHNDKTPPKRPSRRRWGVAVLAVLALLSLAYWWSHRSTMRMTARIVFPLNTYLLNNTPVLIGSDTGALLVSRKLGATITTPATVKLFGWDGKLHWQADIPAIDYLADGSGFLHNPWGNNIIALSPDGHCCALAREIQQTICISSWRDGHRLGNATLPYEADPNEFYHFQIANDGRAWLFSWYKNGYLWAIDGSRVRKATFAPSFPVNLSIDPTSLSPGGKTLLCLAVGRNGTAGYWYYATIQEDSGQIVVKPRYNFAAHYGEDFYSRRTDLHVGWRTDEHAVDCSGMDEVDAAGIRIASSNRNLFPILPGEYQMLCQPISGKQNITPTVFSWLPEKPWQLPLKAERIEGYSYSASSRALLVAAFDPRLINTWHQWPLLNRLAKEYKLPVAPWLAVYTAPGKQQAMLHLPLYGKVDALQLSPDGNRAAMIFKNSDGHQELQFYKW